MVEFATGLLNATVTAGTVFVLAALGELISERAGVLNLGVEGMMIFGAFFGFVGTVVTGSHWIGFAVGALAGSALSLVHAFLCITLKADQTVSGIMLTLLGLGLTSYFGREWITNTIDGFPEITLPIVGKYLVELPVVGPALFRNPATDYIALLMVPVVWAFLYRTNLGLELMSVGEDPETADTMGVDVFRMRYMAVLLGGAFAGAAGAHLSLAYNSIWSIGMTVGRGWIAVALVIFAKWRPSRVLLGAYLFAMFESLQLRSQALSPTFPAQLPLAEAINGVIGFLMHPTIMATYPYLATLIVLVITVARRTDERTATPAALLQAYTRETD